MAEDKQKEAKKDDGLTSLWPVPSDEHPIVTWETSVLGDKRGPPGMGIPRDMVPGSMKFELDVESRELTRTLFPTRQRSGATKSTYSLSESEMKSLVERLSAIRCSGARYNSQPVPADHCGSRTLSVSVRHKGLAGCYIFDNQSQANPGRPKTQYPLFVLPDACTHEFFLELFAPYFTVKKSI